MNTSQRKSDVRVKWVLAIVVTVAASFAATLPAAAATDLYQATFVEPYGGPNQSPFSCPPGTSCGTANVARLGHGSSVVQFFACGPACQLRTVTFTDGSTLFIVEEGNIADFSSPGNSGQNGYIGFGLPGNPQFLDITQTIVGGTGRLAGATGSATGKVKVAGGVGTISVTGTITLP